MQQLRFAGLFTTIALLASVAAIASTLPTVGLRDNTPDVHAFVHATIIPEPGEQMDDTTLIIRDGIIQDMGDDVTIPEDARIWNMEGMMVYPGLIEPAYVLDNQKDIDEDESSLYWNQNIRPERSALSVMPESISFDSYRKAGFTVAQIVPSEGYFAGTTDIITLSDGATRDRILAESVLQSMVTEDTEGAYPSSLMGAIALIRQSMMDAQWYEKARAAYSRNHSQDAPETNHSLEAMLPVLSGDQSVLYNTMNMGNLQAMRVWRLMDEFDFDGWMLGHGYEYQYLDEYASTGHPILLPLDFPDKPTVKSFEETTNITLSALRHWEMAPSNPVLLLETGIEYALTTYESDSVSDFMKDLRTSLERGLHTDDALAALTTLPAEWLGIDDVVGSLAKGKRAHLVVTDGDLFDEDTTVMQVWIDKEQFVFDEKAELEPAGTWQLANPAMHDEIHSITMEITGDAPKVSVSLIPDVTPVKADWADMDRDRLSFNIDGTKLGHPGVLQMVATVGETTMTGYGSMPDGKRFIWDASVMPSEDEAESEKTQETTESEEEETFVPIARTVYPPNPWGREEVPAMQKHVFVHKATIWTSGPDGILEDADMLITDGRIARIGVDLTPPAGAHVINANGRHVTPGLIDAHSHIALQRGVNEVGQGITAEVRIGDVINHTDVSIYRQLAGGLTTSHLMHGSANPIGGQCQVVKFRWGMLPEEMKETRADGTIKFALGENVKQSNWGDNFTTRYPQTRMGVESIIEDRFLAAKDYMRDWETWRASNRSDTVPPRRDLELDALVEILNRERWIHCHSYRQDEILMLMRLGEKLGFQVGTFQHILEGYKVAEVMAKHGAMGSAFSDWWAFKFEVYDAIPFAGALMHEQGVVVSFNSDDAELARRLNGEAAKATKYGGVPEEEALKFVTLNAAKQLKIDEYVGSLEPGKDGDFVVWNTSPLSSYARCEQTWIEGRKFFDLDDDRLMRARVAEERNQLIQKMLGAEMDDPAEENEWSEEDEEFWFETEFHTDQRGLCGCMSEEDHRAVLLRNFHLNQLRSKGE